MSWQEDTIVNSSPNESSWQNDPVIESPGKLESFGRGAANNFPLAPQAIATLSPGDYSTNLADWNEKAAVAKKANPISYGTGAVAGVAAPLLIPGVGEALEAAPVAMNAGLGAASAISNTDLLKHPGEAMHEGVMGAGIGGLTAGILGKVLPNAEGLENFANKKAIQSVEMPSGIVGSMSPEERSALGEFIQNNNLVGRDKSQILEQARSLSKKFGSKIGEIADTVEESGLHANPETHMSKIDELLNKAQSFKGSANREAKSLARDYTAGASDILNLSDNPSWSSIQKLKEQYGKLAFDSKGEVKSEGAKDTYFALKDMLKDIAEKAKNSNLAPEYKAALSGYSQMQPIESGLEKAVDAELRGSGAGMGVRGMVGLIKKMPGPVRAIAGPAAAMSGHPLVGLAAALPELTNPAIQSKVASGMAGIAKRLPSTIGPAINQELHGHLIDEAVNEYLMKHFKNAD